MKRCHGGGRAPRVSNSSSSRAEGRDSSPGRYRRIDASSVTRKDKRFDDNDLIVVFDEKGKLISSTLVQRSCSALSLFRARSRRNGKQG